MDMRDRLVELIRQEQSCSSEDIADHLIANGVIAPPCKVGDIRMKNIWAVTYYDIGDDPVVTMFDNKPAAIKCYEYFLGKHDRVNIDEAPIYKSFINKS